MGTFEMVLKRARPCSSRLVPVGAPIGFSGALSSVGASVFSAQFSSDALGWRPSKTSEIGLSAMVLDTLAFGLFSGIPFPASFLTLALMIEERPPCCKMARPTERLVQVEFKYLTTGGTEETSVCLTPLDACFLRHLCWSSFGGGDSEGISAVVAAYSGVRRIQGAWPLSRLLVLDTARAAAAISASVETESRARIRRAIWAEDFSRDRNLLRRDGGRDEKPLRSHLFHRICACAGGAGHTQIRARRARSDFLRRQPRGHARGARITDGPGAVLARRRLLRLGGGVWWGGGGRAVSGAMGTGGR